jgi:8-hydroxy-5-deazaflavin:NADPH oxidoreductase
MRIAVLGTGSVGRRIAGKLVELGHEVTMGSRSAGNEALREWVSDAGEGAAGGNLAGKVLASRPPSPRRGWSSR